MPSCRGFLVLLGLIMSASCGIFGIVVPSLVFLLISPSIPRSTASAASHVWHTFATFLLEYIGGVQVKFLCPISQQERLLQTKQSSIVISNHRTRIDWMFLWCLFLRMEVLHQLRVILKDGLRKIPIFGWAMQFFRFIFLQRNWTLDQQYLDTILRLIRHDASNSTLLLFPEGTDLSAKNLEKSHAFALAQDLPPRRYSLYPRTTGWNYIYHQVKTRIDVIIDVTMMYVDHEPGERPNELSVFLSGRFPRQIVFYLEVTPSADFTTNTDEKINHWLESQFEQKEARLAAYYERQTLPSDSVELWPASGSGRRSQVHQILAVLFWTLSGVIQLLVFVHFRWFRWYVGLVSVIGLALMQSAYRLDLALFHALSTKGK